MRQNRPGPAIIESSEFWGFDVIERFFALFEVFHYRRIIFQGQYGNWLFFYSRSPRPWMPLPVHPSLASVEDDLDDCRAWNRQTLGHDIHLEKGSYMQTWQKGSLYLCLVWRKLASLWALALVYTQYWSLCWTGPLLTSHTLKQYFNHIDIFPTRTKHIEIFLPISCRPIALTSLNSQPSAAFNPKPKTSSPYPQDTHRAIPLELEICVSKLSSRLIFLYDDCLSVGYHGSQASRGNRNILPSISDTIRAGWGFLLGSWKRRGQPQHGWKFTVEVDCESARMCLDRIAGFLKWIRKWIESVCYMKADWAMMWAYRYSESCRGRLQCQNRIVINA